MCGTFRKLRERLGEDLVISVTPYSQTRSMYDQLGSSCPELISWCVLDCGSGSGSGSGSAPLSPARLLRRVNWEGYITAGSRWSDIQHTASVFGWDKAVFGISTQGGTPGISSMAGWSGDEVTSGIIAQAKGADPKGSGVKGVFFWTAEWSALPAPPCHLAMFGHGVC